MQPEVLDEGPTSTGAPLKCRVFGSKYATTRQGRPKVWYTDGAAYPGPTGEPAAYIWSHPRGDAGNASYEGYVPWNWVKLYSPVAPANQGGGDDPTCPVCGRITCKHMSKGVKP